MIGGGWNRRTAGFRFPMEIWPDISTPLAAGLAGEARLDIGQPDVSCSHPIYS
jgi:hypothetical protein